MIIKVGWRLLCWKTKDAFPSEPKQVSDTKKERKEATYAQIPQGVLPTACYALALVMPALLAVPLSAGGQPGHITAGNAFLAPFLGPWSETLPPNAHPVSGWPPQQINKAVILSIAIGVPILLSCLTKGKIAGTATVLGVLLLLVWAGHGMIKVIIELS